MNRNSIKTYHELAGVMPISFAPGIAADIRRERHKADKAKQARNREKAYW